MIKRHRIFFLTLFVALIVRIYLLIWSVTYPLDLNGDQSRYEDWAQSAHIYGFAKTYDQSYVHILANHMPPGTLYTASGAYESYILVGKVVNKLTHTTAGSIHWVNTYLLHIMMRLPSVLADLLIGVLLYLLVQRESTVKRGIFAALLFLFNPLVIYNSTIWGQMDASTNLFFILALYLAFSKKYILSILSFASSVFIKFSLLPLFPFFLIFLYFHSGKQWKKLVIGLGISFVAVVAATYPVSTQPLQWLQEHWPIFSQGELGNMTIAAFNFWWAITCWPLICYRDTFASHFFLGITLGTWGYLLFGLLATPLFYWQIVKSKYFIQKQNIFFVFALIALAVFLVMPKMHDRYLYPFFPLFAVAVSLSKEYKKYFIFFCFLSIVHFANLLSSWYPTRYPAQIYHDISYSLPYRWGISVLTVVAGFWLYIIGFNIFRSKKRQESSAKVDKKLGMRYIK